MMCPHAAVQSSKYMNNVEARRNCFISMASVVTNIGFDFDLSERLLDFLASR
jgi:hypothetical protein